MSNLNSVNTVTVAEAKEYIRHQIKAHFARLDRGEFVNAPIFIHSAPGLGKSSIIHQLCEEEKLELRDFRLASSEAADVNGIPFVSRETDDMKFSIPEWFPRDPDSRGILFLDELTNAPIPVQHAAYGLVLDRMLNGSGVKLPKGWIVICAGNRKEDKTGVKGLNPALANRILGGHLYVTPDVEAFTGYALRKGLHESVVAFLQSQHEYLLKPTTGEDAWPSPRAWEGVSNFLHTNPPPSIKDIGLMGMVGVEAATAFKAFMEFFDKLPDWEKVMAGKGDYYELPTGAEGRGVMFALVTMAASLTIRNIEDEKKTNNLFEFVNRIKFDDFLIVYCKMVKAAIGSAKTGKLYMNSPGAAKVIDRVIEYI